jgi:hypothetical protein
MWTASNGKTYANVGAALRGGHFGDFGRDKTVRLTREGYTPTTIARGGSGWYVQTMGNATRRKPIVIGKRVV